MGSGATVSLWCLAWRLDMGGLFSSSNPNDNYEEKVKNPSAGMGYDQTALAAQRQFQGVQQDQNQYIQGLQAQAAGNGPSVAEQMLQRATQQNQQNNASAIASQRGMNPALASKLLLDQNAASQQTAAGQGAQMRAGEMLNAQGLLGQALATQGQQNLGALGTAGGLQNQGALGAAGINAGLAEGAANNNPLGKIVGGVAGGAGAAMMAAHGGEVPDGQATTGMAYPQIGPALVGGGKVPGKALTPGDSPRNDVVDAKLSPGEIVLPRSVTKGEDAPDAAKRFVQAILRRKNAGKAKHHETLHHVRKAKAALDALAKHMGAEE
jgi:hypothetical protein